jgi:hypothetical protein
MTATVTDNGQPIDGHTDVSLRAHLLVLVLVRVPVAVVEENVTS